MIHCEDNLWVLEDQDSANGTFVDGERLSRLEIKRAVNVAVGDAEGPRLILVPTTSGQAGIGGEETVAAVAEALLGATGATRARRRRTRVITIGRGADNDIVVDDPLVSWHHAEVRESADEGYELVDLSSHNGTYLNGQKITRTPLRQLDRITIGDHSYRFHGSRLEEIRPAL
jgi:pSer/pThr/pTyr-binding forkhead associated (FHA) protein